MKKLSCKSVALIPSKSGNQICELDVPFVPTPLEIVNQMLSISTIRKDDILYDLGCGDGRIVIAAAKIYGIRCVGVDLDPRRIQECHQNAKKASVEPNLTFICNNFFDVDLRNATLISLYLLSNVNIRLRSKLFTECRAGCRIISHDFSMDKWIADKRIFIDNHTLYMWTIPANVSGVWRWSIPILTDSIKFGLQINQIFQKTSAKVISPQDLIVKAIKINGVNIKIKMNLLFKSRSISLDFSGIIDNNNIHGKFRTPEISIGEWLAIRDQSTITPFV